MKDGLKIRWTEEASKNLEEIIFYLEANWTAKELKKLFQKLEKQLHLLSIFPEAFPFSLKKRNVRRCVITQNLTIYYTVGEGILILLSIFDTRQHPNKMKG